MAFDLVNFMDALARFIATATGLNYAELGAPRAIWRNQANDIDGQCTTPFSTLRCYPGSIGWVPLPTPAIQVETIGANDAALTRAFEIMAALADADGRALRNVTLSVAGVPKWRINGILPRGLPGQVGRDDKGRSIVVWNFDAEALAL